MYLRMLRILLFRTRDTSSNFAAIVLALYGRKYVWCAIHGLLRGKELCVVRDLRNHFLRGVEHYVRQHRASASS